MDSLHHKLYQGMDGEDVKLLQASLKKLGFTIPDNEANERIFGSFSYKVQIHSAYQFFLSFYRISIIEGDTIRELLKINYLALMV
jgi:hypothetical protein